MLAAAALVVCALTPRFAAARTPVAAGVGLFIMPQSHASPVLQLIRSARQSIRLEVYLLTNRSIVTELEKARQRGVDVRVLLEEHPFEGARYARLGYSLLQSGRVPVRWANEGAFTFTHEKALTIDSHIAGIFTFNLTSSGLFRNREFGVVDRDAADARALADVFDADWARRPARYRSGARLVISPYNARRAFTSLIDGARHTLDLYAEEVNDASIESHLAGAARRGVRVRLITSQESGGVDAIRQAGVAVKVMAHPYVHAKAMVADGTQVFVGSENISGTSLDKNREVGVELADSAMAAGVEHTFASDWGSNPGTTPASPTTPPPVHQGSGVRVTVSPASVHRGEQITVTASTAPRAECTIRVTYPDGYVSRARSLSGLRTASASGSARWSWRVGSRVTGTTEVSVTCAAGSTRSTGSASFTIE